MPRKRMRIKQPRRMKVKRPPRMGVRDPNKGLMLLAVQRYARLRRMGFRL